MDFFDDHRGVRQVSHKGAKVTQRHKEKLKSNFVPCLTWRLCVEPKVAQLCPPGIARARSLNANRVPSTNRRAPSQSIATVPKRVPALAWSVCPEHRGQIAIRHQTVAHATKPAATPPRDKHGIAASETPSLHSKPNLPQTAAPPSATTRRGARGSSTCAPCSCCSSITSDTDPPAAHDRASLRAVHSARNDLLHPSRPRKSFDYQKPPLQPPETAPTPRAQRRVFPAATRHPNPEKQQTGHPRVAPRRCARRPHRDDVRVATRVSVRQTRARAPQ